MRRSIRSGDGMIAALIAALIAAIALAILNV
jgi:hypothetical protein